MQVLHSRSACENISYAPRDFGRPADDLLTIATVGEIGKDFIGLAIFVAGLLALDKVMTAPRVVLFGFNSRLPHFQFAVTSATAIYSLAVGALSSCSGLRDYYHPWMRLRACPLDARLPPGHHSRVIALCFITVISSGLHVIPLRDK